MINVLLYNGVVHLRQLCNAADARAWEHADLRPGEVAFVNELVGGVQEAFRQAVLLCVLVYGTLRL